MPIAVASPDLEMFSAFLGFISSCTALIIEGRRRRAMQSASHLFLRGEASVKAEESHAAFSAEGADERRPLIYQFLLVCLVCKDIFDL